MARVRATAAHELFHVVQARYRQKCFYDEDRWAWFSEATAVFMQKEVFPDDLEYLRYLYLWFDEPDKPLHQNPDGWREYGGAVFCEFLRDKYGKELPGTNLLQEVWTRAADFESPFEAIEARLRHHYGRDVLFAAADTPDLFTDEFLAWNFFLGTHPNGYANGELYEERFQHAFADRIVFMKPGDKASWIGSELAPLAARYHLVEVPQGPGMANIAVDLCCPGAGQSPCKGAVCPVSDKRTPLRSEPFPIYLRPAGTTDRCKGNCEVDLSTWPNVRYLLLIVANTQWKAQGNGFIDEYQISVEVTQEMSHP
jgi:hypothetical protein